MFLNKVLDHFQVQKCFKSKCVAFFGVQKFCFENFYGEKNILVIEFFFFENSRMKAKYLQHFCDEQNNEIQLEIGNWNKYLGFINQQEKVRIENIPALKSGKEIF